MTYDLLQTHCQVHSSFFWLYHNSNVNINVNTTLIAQVRSIPIVVESSSPPETRLHQSGDTIRSIQTAGCNGSNRAVTRQPLLHFSQALHWPLELETNLREIGSFTVTEGEGPF